MIVINSNKKTGVSVHDTIKYDGLEKQVFDILSTQGFEKVSYKIDGKSFYVFLDGIQVNVEIKKSVKLSVGWDVTRAYDDGGGGRFNSPSATLPLNKDVTKQLDKFCQSIKKYINANKAGGEIQAWLEDQSTQREVEDRIKKFLVRELGGDGLDIGFWMRDYQFFNGLGISFYIYPKNQAPADGVLMYLDTDGTLETFWNNSTPRRTHGNNPELVENVFNRGNYGNTVSEMESKINAIKKLQKKIDAFDYTKSEDMVDLINKKIEANKIRQQVL
jgi:hypothetical protein